MGVVPSKCVRQIMCTIGCYCSVKTSCSRTKGEEIAEWYTYYYWICVCHQECYCQKGCLSAQKSHEIFTWDFLTRHLRRVKIAVVTFLCVSKNKPKFEIRWKLVEWKSFAVPSMIIKSASSSTAPSWELNFKLCIHQHWEGILLLLLTPRWKNLGCLAIIF